jgi:hypothetical protein
MPRHNPPTLTDQQKSEVDKIVEEAPPKEGEVPKPKADKSSVAIHVTKPLPTSLAKLKAHRKPRKKVENRKEGNENVQGQDNARPFPRCRDRKARIYPPDRLL